MLEIFIHTSCAAIALVAAAIDYRTGRIPNWLTLPALGVAFAVALVAHGPAGLGASVLAALACGFVPYLMFRRGAAGGGDVKLLGALGALGGLYFGLEAQFYAYGAAAAWALVMLAWRGRLLQTLLNSVFLLVNPVLPASRRRALSAENMTTLRFGPSIFIGVSLAIAVRWGGGF